MKIFTTSQMRQLDQYTCCFEPIDSLSLMERASQKFTEAFVHEVSPDRRIFVFAGPGNNGGDALAIARLLAARNYFLEVYLFDSKDKLSIECKINKTQLLSLIPTHFFEISTKLPFIDINVNDIVIDGLWGSGLNKPITGLAADLIRLINQSGAKVYAIDIPSGLQGENNDENMPSSIIKAFRTFTFHSPKLAFLLPDNAPYLGDWTVLDIGLHPEGVRQLQTPFYFTEKEDVRPMIRQRNRFAYKNNFGHALLAAGSRGKIGAAVLAAKACLKIGAGLVTVHLPACGEIIVQTAVPEAMIKIDKEKDCISDVEPESFSSVGIGPGIGTSLSTQLALEKILRQSKKPLILDADALNIISQRREWMKLIPENSILTPHVGEFDRLVGKSSSAYERLEKARMLATELSSILILKGAFTAVCLLDGTVHFNSSGNPGMATAGSGDVLTGILTGLLAQSYAPEEAALLGVFLHGRAGDKAAEKLSQQSLIAGDIIDHLGESFVNLTI
ncbi:MAG: NAD(P)H-hydrate dehydratase [Candidatus Azobacteroides sp.]|nr:NAD(P)H-hydrate dehydratase [Candidatus Azobacteroides sp.]